MIKLINPFKPHVSKRGNTYVIRKLDPFLFWLYFPLNRALPLGHSQWYVDKYCKFNRKEEAEMMLKCVRLATIIN